MYNLERKNSFHEELSTSDTSDFTADVGTARYRAPETYGGNINYNEKVDIYSCGVLLYELFENNRHVPGTHMTWHKCPKLIRDLIEKCMLSVNPENRTHALMLLEKLNTCEYNNSFLRSAMKCIYRTVI